MPVILQPKDSTLEYANSSVTTYLLNDLDFFDKEANETVKDKIESVYKTDAIETRPHCQCLDYVGEALLGYTCPSCNTKVEDPFAKYESTLYVKELVEGIPFITPDYWNRLENFIVIQSSTSSKFSIWRYVASKGYRYPKINKANQIIIDVVKNIEGFERSYTWLLNNLPLVIDTITTIAKYKDAYKLEEAKILKQLWLQNRNLVTTSYMPLPSSRYFVRESTKKGNVVKLTLGLLNDSIQQISNAIAFSFKGEDYLIEETGKFVANLASFYYKELSEIASGKHGLFRKNLFGTRAHYTARCVIVPHERLDMEITEVHFPYKLSVALFRFHITNKLLKMKMSHKEISKRLWSAILQFDPLVYEVLNTLIVESGIPEFDIDGVKPGIPVLITRNPSQTSHSTQALKVTKIKDDITDNTMNIHQLTLVSYNGDHDGDELNILLIHDKTLQRRVKVLHPYYAIPDNVKPNDLGPSFTAAGVNFHLVKWLDDKQTNKITIPPKYT